MEIIGRIKGKTLWLGKDAEGRAVYAQTTDRDQMAVEPTGNLMFYSLSAARRAAKDAKRIV